ncbi:MAG: hypothetical protein KY468_05260 [Armatimonadetes bacterium]|nr:hypothetical protein [Armatimonadota bacterium]
MERSPVRRYIRKTLACLPLCLIFLSGCNQLYTDFAHKGQLRRVKQSDRYLAAEMGLQIYRYHVIAPKNHRLLAWCEWWKNGRNMGRIGHLLHVGPDHGTDLMERDIEFSILQGRAIDRPDRVRIGWISLGAENSPPGVSSFSRLMGYEWYDAYVMEGNSMQSALDEVILSPGETRVLIAYNGNAMNGFAESPTRNESELKRIKSALVCKVQFQFIEDPRSIPRGPWDRLVTEEMIRAEKLKE